ncbi:MAG TPA: hypothetical protein PLW86_00180 [Rhodocyclaceae bacterium]|nr:hypothetical protein [Rhodocyclaceae bacterium]
MQSPARWLDRLILLWIMPPLGFAITVLQSEELRYLNANHTLVAVLFGAIVLRWQLQVPSRQLALRLLLSALLMAAFFCIEWLHLLNGRLAIDALDDPRMIVYSPFYGSIMLFVLYAIYLALLDKAEQQQHLAFFVSVMCWFHLLFLGYWLLLYAEWIPEIPRADLLHANSVAYLALFVLCLMLFYRKQVAQEGISRLVFLAVNISVILANQTRGAILVLLAVGFYLLLERLASRWRVMTAALALGALICTGAALTLTEDTPLTRVLGADAEALGAVMDEIAVAYESGASHVGVSANLVSDESSLSAFSRIGSNYYSLMSFLDHPLLGIGQADAYAIKVIGAGVHSLHFLIANATGLVGLALFAALLAALASARGSVVVARRSAMMFALCFGYMLVFVNAIPIYFALVLVVLSESRNRRPWQAADQEPVKRVVKHIPTQTVPNRRWCI